MANIASQKYILFVQINNSSKQNSKIMHNVVDFIHKNLVYIQMNGDRVSIVAIPEKEKNNQKYRTLFKQYNLTGLPCLFVPTTDNGRPAVFLGFNEIKFALDTIIKDQKNIIDKKKFTDVGDADNFEDILKNEMTFEKREADVGNDPSQLNEDMSNIDIGRAMAYQASKRKHLESNFAKQELDNKKHEPPPQRPSNVQDDGDEMAKLLQGRGESWD